MVKSSLVSINLSQNCCAYSVAHPLDIRLFLPMPNSYYLTGLFIAFQFDNYPWQSFVQLHEHNISKVPQHQIQHRNADPMDGEAVEMPFKNKTLVSSMFQTHPSCIPKESFDSLEPSALLLPMKLE